MPPLIACSPVTYGRYGLRGMIPHLREAGLQAIQLPIVTTADDSPFADGPSIHARSSAKEIEQVRQWLTDHGIRIACCHLGGENPLEHEVVETLYRKLEKAAQCGASVVVGSAGEAETADDRALLYRNLEDIGDRAADLGILYCCDTAPGICQHHYGMLETMTALQHPQVKLSFDAADLMYYNEFVNAEVALAKVCHHVRHVDLKDSHGEYGRWDFPTLGNGGAVDFVRVLQLMHVTGFPGPYTIEIAGVAQEPEPTYEQHHQRLLNSVKHLRNCGYFD